MNIKSKNSRKGIIHTGFGWESTDEPMTKLIRKRPIDVYGPKILDGKRRARCLKCKVLLPNDEEAWFLDESNLAVFFCEKCAKEKLCK